MLELGVDSPSDSFAHLRRWLRRLRARLLGDATSGFDLDMTSRAAAQAIFEEGSGSLLTDGSRACMEASHLEYGALLDSASGERGLRLIMDGQGLTCGHGAEIAVGHLASWQYYSYGDFEWRARVHHAPDGSAPPSNSFTCFSAFVHGDKIHNELAWCFPARDGSEASHWRTRSCLRTTFRRHCTAMELSSSWARTTVSLGRECQRGHLRPRSFLIFGVTLHAYFRSSENSMSSSSLPGTATSSTR